MHNNLYPTNLHRRNSLCDRILSYLERHPEWHNGGEIEELAMRVGYKASNASRRLRELYEEGQLDREERKGRNARSVWYRLRAKTTLF